MQWPKDTKKAIRISKSTKNRQYNGQQIPKPLYCLFLLDLLILIAPLVSFDHCIVFSSSIYWFWFPFGIFWPLYCLFFVTHNIMAKRYQRGNQNQSIDEEHTIQWPKDPKGAIRTSKSTFWLPLWYLLAIVLSVLRRFTDSDYLFGIFWPLYCLFFVDLLILIAPLVYTMAKRSQRGNQNQ
jgi:hypothetical protein